MAPLSQVRPPTSPGDGRLGRLVGLVAIGLLVAMLKPWGDGRPAENRPFTTPAPAVAAPRIVLRSYRPDEFGPVPPGPAWELWAAGHVTGIRFVGPADGFVAPRPSAGGPGARAVIGGPVIELGSSEDLAAIAINRPSDVRLAAVRMWRFSDGGSPVRIELVELDAPWPAAHFRVFGRRGASVPPGALPGWEPGLYRLDLLIDPVDRIRTLLLVVRPGIDQLVDPTAAPGVPEPDLRLLQRLPDAATIWSYGTLLTGWSRPVAPNDCRVAELWRAVDVDDPCHPIPVGRSTTVGVNLPARRIVTSIAIRQVDPLPGPIDGHVSTWVDGRAGLAMIHVPPPGLPDGIYRLDVGTSDGTTLHWYLEAGG
jgi:hypothetical protein